MEIGRGGRELTKVGQDYLKNIDKYLEDIKTVGTEQREENAIAFAAALQPLVATKIVLPTRINLPSGTEVATT